MSFSLPGTNVERVEVHKISLTNQLIDYMVKRSRGMTKTQVVDEIKLAIGVAFSNTITHLTDWIHEKVPKATGNLQDHLIESMINSPGFRRLLNSIGHKTTGQVLATPKKVSLRIGLDPANPVPYAKYVDAMSTRQVRHTGVVRIGKRGGLIGRNVAWVNRHGYYGNIILADPMAQGGYAGKLVREAFTYFSSALQNAIQLMVTQNKNALWQKIKP